LTNTESGLYRDLIFEIVYKVATQRKYSEKVTISLGYFFSFYRK